jgi:lysozyme
MGSRTAFFTDIKHTFGRAKLTQPEVDDIDKALDRLGVPRDGATLAHGAGPNRQGMTLGKLGLDLIKSFEGFVDYAYDDQRRDAHGRPLRIDEGSTAKGVLTIGYGHTRGVIPGQTCTEPEAESMLRGDVAHAEQAVGNSVEVALTQNQFDALVSLVFNIGESAFRKSTLLARLNTGSYKAAADQFLRWTYDDGKQLQGLVNRRNRERELFLSTAV